MDDLELFFSVNGFYLWAGLAVVVLFALLWILAMQIRLSQVVRHYRSLLIDVDGANLEQVLDRQVALLEQTSTKLAALQAEVEAEGQTLRRAVQKVGLVRFNPFSDTGGDQSFSVALLDSYGDGVVFSSLFSRAETRVFAKPIQRGESRYALSDEERQAIATAMAAPAAQAPEPAR
jgi:Na+-transporting methylmalonyl-CoA/oxaloacetate decarboxylase gamma subunit